MGQALQPCQRVKPGSAVADHAAHPFIQREFLAVAGIEFLPDLGFGRLSVENESIEVKDGVVTVKARAP